MEEEDDDEEEIDKESDEEREEDDDDSQGSAGSAGAEDSGAESELELQDGSNSEGDEAGEEDAPAELQRKKRKEMLRTAMQEQQNELGKRNTKEQTWDLRGGSGAGGTGSREAGRDGGPTGRAAQKKEAVPGPAVEPAAAALGAGLGVWAERVARLGWNAFAPDSPLFRCPPDLAQARRRARADHSLQGAPPLRIVLPSACLTVWSIGCRRRGTLLGRRPRVGSTETPPCVGPLVVTR